MTKVYIVVFYGRLVKTMFDEVCLSKTPWRHQGNVIPIREEINQGLGFLYSVAEIIRTCISVCHKRILCHILAYFLVQR